MADLAQTATIEWGEFSQLAAVPAHSKIASVVQAPDGRSLSILLEGVDARCDGSGQKSATAVLVGSVEANIPASTDWTATRGDFRGQLALSEGARATIQFGLARATDAETMVASLDGGGDSVDLIRTLYSPAEAVWPTVGSEAVSYAPLTVSVQLTVSCAGAASAALVAVDAIDLELWVR